MIYRRWENEKETPLVYYGFYGIIKNIYVVTRREGSKIFLRGGGGGVD